MDAAVRATRQAGRAGVQCAGIQRTASAPLSSRSLASDAPRDELRAYVSQSTSPTFNLALEDHLYRTCSLTRARPWRPSSDDDDDDGDEEKGPRPLCLIYRNRPCVVIGRNQNPWKELNVREMARLGIPMIRRRSGGGAVFHDLGNTNYSIHVARNDFTKRANAELVARGLNRLLLPSQSLPDRFPQPSVYVNHRSDICVRISPSPFLSALPPPSDPTIRPDPPDPAERKLSGSAYKLTAHRAYHHGTLLLDADLAQLGHSLRNARGDALQSKGVASVRASVVNLLEAFPERRGGLGHDAVTQAIVAEFGRTYAADDSELGFFREHPLEASRVEESSPMVTQLPRDSVLWESYHELQSWDWLFGQTPEFTHALVAQPSPDSNLKASQLSRHTNARDVDPQPTAAHFPFGTFGLLIRCRRGIIEEARLTGLSPGPSGAPLPAETEGRAPTFRDAGTEDTLRALVGRLEGKRYDDVAEEVPSYLDGRTEDAFPSIRTEEAVSARLRRAAVLLGVTGHGSPADPLSLAFVQWLREVL